MLFPIPAKSMNDRPRTRRTYMTPLCPICAGICGRWWESELLLRAVPLMLADVVAHSVSRPGGQTGSRYSLFRFLAPGGIDMPPS